MKAKICDRCGIAYTDNKYQMCNCNYKVNGIHLVNEVNGGHNHIETFDLCDDCISSFMSFMNDVTDA